MAMIHATGMERQTSFFLRRRWNGNRIARNFSHVIVRRFIKEATIAEFCTNVTRRHMADPKTQASYTYISKVTNGMQNTVMSKSDTTKLTVDRLEEFLLFAEKRITIKMGIFPASEITAMENSETTITSRSSFVKIQLTEVQTWFPELLAVVLLILAGCFENQWSWSLDCRIQICKYKPLARSAVAPDEKVTDGELAGDVVTRSLL